MTYYRWVDVAKGIGILCVVFGHAVNQINIENISNNLSFLRSMVYSFHIPLFFFISGVLLSINISWKEFIQKKVNRLIIPYFLNFLVISLTLCVTYYLLQFPHSFSWFNYVKAMIYGTIGQFMYQTGTNILNPLWFLPSLLLALIIGKFLLDIINLDFLLGLILVIIIVGIGYNIALQSIHLPWGLDIALVMQIFIIPGYFFKKLHYSQIERPSILIFVLSMIGFFFSFNINGGIESSQALFNNFYFFWLTAICASLAIYCLSAYLVHFSLIEKILSYFEKNSLVILCFHMVANIVIIYIAGLFPQIMEIYYSNIYFEFTFMLVISMVFIQIINKIPIMNRLFQL
ncbi:acyltransferase family protein [Methanospirillum stamsii]|uniref:acyltransferase family protein n=1 Tax=Methanospirillum stamsii TaxID=1277351 RepID=UPI0015E840B4|nr:acyltransferase family protein [Methanospirillum stamsii]